MENEVSTCFCAYLTKIISTNHILTLDDKLKLIGFM